MAEVINLGICNICNVSKIWQRNPITKNIETTDMYTEFSFVLNDGFIYRHGVCINCINDLNETKVKNVVERIKETWRKEMVGWAKDKDFENLEKKEVTAYHQDEEIALKLHIEKKQEKIKNKEENAKNLDK